MHRARAFSMFLAACAALAGWAAATAAERPVWELRPYRVRVLVGVAARPEVAARLPAVLAGRLAERIRGLQGGAWDVTASPAPAALQQAMTASLAGVTADALPKDSLDGDKVMLLQVSAAADGCQVAARELDVATGLWSTPASRQAGQLSQLPDLSLAAVFEAFAPLARVNVVKDGQVVLRLRASAWKPRDPGLQPVRPGAVFRLAARAVAGPGAARTAPPIPWTFCTIEQVAEEELRGRLDTGLREPLPAGWESSLEVLALRVAPPRQSSILTLNSMAQPAQPLAGYEIYAAASAGENPVFLGRTDRQGSLGIAPAGGRPLQIILVKHGDQWLARLPLVAGLEPRLSLVLAPDDRRIDLERWRAGVRDAAVDLTARREALASRVKARIAAGQLEEADQLLKELRQLPSAQDLLASRTAELKKDMPDDPVFQGKIDAVLKDVQNALSSQFDPKAADKLATQIERRRAKPKKP
jgi:hypothetical protein